MIISNFFSQFLLYLPLGGQTMDYERLETKLIQQQNVYIPVMKQGLYDEIKSIFGRQKTSSAKKLSNELLPT